MIRLMTGFMRGMATLATPWRAWIGLLMVVNLVLPMVFISAPEARVVLATFFVAVGLQMAIFRRHGFVRLLGVGHLPWVPMLGWLASRLPLVGTDTPLGQWLIAVLILDGISLIVDGVDVVRYARGDRRPTYRLDASLR